MKQEHQRLLWKLVPIWAYGSNLLSTEVQWTGEKVEQVCQAEILSDELSVYYGKAEMWRSTWNRCFCFHFKAIAASLVERIACIYADGPLGAEYLNTITLDDQFQYFRVVTRVHCIQKGICVLFRKHVGLDYQGT